MKIHKLLIILLVLFLPNSSSAQVLINEIMYDLSGSDTGREWVEVYNSGGGSVDITDYKFLESSGASNHSLTLIQGTASLSNGGLAVIVSDPTKFLIDWPSFSGNLFKASFSMNNTGSTLILKDGDLNILDEVVYSSTQGANGDGDSLQKNNSSWGPASPTPGIQNTTPSNSATSTTTPNPSAENNPVTNSPSNASSGSASAHSSPAPLSEATPKVLFEISAGRDRLTTVGNSVVFQSALTKSEGISENSIFYNWSFGDGSISQGKMVSHSYKFPGEYVVVLNAQSSDLQAVSRINIKVISPQIFISKVSGGIEVHNKTATEINIEGWSVSADQKSFVLPKDTIILANKKVVLADGLTGLSGLKWSLLNPLGQVLAVIDNNEASKIVSLEATTTPNEIVLLQTKLKEARRELARMTNVPKVTVPLVVAEPDAKIVSNPPPEINSTSPNLTSVFVAEKSSGPIGKIFSWPMRGVNWVTRLFVEE